MFALNEQQREVIATVHEINNMIVMLGGNLKQSLRQGDIIPSLISSMVWQTREEIATIWMEEYSPEEWHKLNHPKTSDLLILNFSEKQVAFLVKSVGLQVETALMREPTLIQSFTSRKGLQLSDAQSLNAPDQDRVIASHILIPYNSWVSFFHLLCSDAWLLAFFSLGDVSLEASNGTLTLSREVKKGGYLFPESGDSPRRLENSDSHYMSIQGGATHIEWRGGVKQSIIFDAPTLRNALGYIVTPEMEATVRNVVLSKYNISVWKHKGGRGNSAKDKERLIGEFSWQN